MNNDNHDQDTVTAELEKAAALDAKNNMTELTQGSDAYSMQQKLGALQRIITAVSKDKENEELRQILLLAAFDNKQEAMLAADAISERQRYGVGIEPILNRIIAQCAVHAGRVDKVLSAMSNYTLNTNSGSNKTPFWKRKQEDKNIS